MSDYVARRKPPRVVLLTECSMSDNVALQYPDLDFVRPCNLCPHMKRITLPKIRRALETMSHEVTVAPEIAEGARRSVERRCRVRPLCFPVRIVRIRRKAEPEARRVALPAPIVKLHQPRGSAEKQDQHTCRQRIKRAKMPNLPESREMPHRIDNVVGSFSPRLIDHERAVKRRRLRLAWH